MSAGYFMAEVFVIKNENFREDYAPRQGDVLLGGHARILDGIDAIELRADTESQRRWLVRCELLRGKPFDCAVLSIPPALDFAPG